MIADTGSDLGLAPWWSDGWQKAQASLQEMRRTGPEGLADEQTASRAQTRAGGKQSVDETRKIPSCRGCGRGGGRRVMARRSATTGQIAQTVPGFPGRIGEKGPVSPRRLARRSSLTADCRERWAGPPASRTAGANAKGFALRAVPDLRRNDGRRAENPAPGDATGGRNRGTEE
jgi:hypothetical protein